MAVLIHLMRGIALRCPHCGEGRLYRSLFLVRETCATCEHPFQRVRGDWTGGVEITIILGVMLSLALFFLLFTFTSLPFNVMLAAVLAFPLVFIPFFYRHVKGFWIGLIRVWEGANPQPNPLREPEWFRAFWENER